MTTQAKGLIQRSNDSSFFLRCHESSHLAIALFGPNPIYRDKPIQVLQVMMITEGYLLIECVNIEKI